MRRLVLLSVVLFAALLPFVALADVAVPLAAIVPAWVHTLIEVLGSIIAVASALANVVAPTTPYGKGLHYLALNGPQIQKTIADIATDIAPLVKK